MSTPTLNTPTMTIQQLHELYMDRSSWILRMSQPRTPRVNSHGRAAGGGPNHGRAAGGGPNHVHK